MTLLPPALCGSVSGVSGGGRKRTASLATNTNFLLFLHLFFLACYAIHARISFHCLSESLPELYMDQQLYIFKKATENSVLYYTVGAADQKIPTP
jgi:hypothetical protein